MKINENKYGKYEKFNYFNKFKGKLDIKHKNERRKLLVNELKREVKCVIDKNTSCYEKIMRDLYMN